MTVTSELGHLLVSHPLPVFVCMTCDVDFCVCGLVVELVSKDLKPSSCCCSRPPAWFFTAAAPGSQGLRCVRTATRGDTGLAVWTLTPKRGEEYRTETKPTASDRCAHTLQVVVPSNTKYIHALIYNYDP